MNIIISDSILSSMQIVNDTTVHSLELISEISTNSSRSIILNQNSGNVISILEPLANPSEESIFNISTLVSERTPSNNSDLNNGLMQVRGNINAPLNTSKSALKDLLNAAESDVWFNSKSEPNSENDTLSLSIQKSLDSLFLDLS